MLPNYTSSHRYLGSDDIAGIKNLYGNKNNNIISGTSVVCTSQNYSIPNLPAGLTVSWVASPDGVANISTSGTSATLTRISNGTITLTATVQSTCGNVNVVKNQIHLGGTPPTIYDVSETTPICPGQINYAYNGESTDGYYNWQVSGGTIISGQGTSTVGFYADPLVPPNTSSTLGLYLVIHGECGYEVSKGISIPVTNCSGGGGTNWSVFPNPANDAMTVKYQPLKGRSDLGESFTVPPFEVNVTNEEGRLLIDTKNSSGNDHITLNTANLPTGNYFLHIKTEKEIIKKQILIDH